MSRLGITVTVSIMLSTVICTCMYNNGSSYIGVCIQYQSFVCMQLYICIKLDIAICMRSIAIVLHIHMHAMHAMTVRLLRIRNHIQSHRPYNTKLSGSYCQLMQVAIAISFKFQHRFIVSKYIYHDTFFSRAISKWTTCHQILDDLNSCMHIANLLSVN